MTKIQVTVKAVSYTHLDVYKRQMYISSIDFLCEDHVCPFICLGEIIFAIMNMCFEPQCELATSVRFKRSKTL